MIKIMVSQPIWIMITIVVFFVGIGASYAHFANTYDPISMKFQNQGLFDQMMSNNPRMSQQWMDSDMMNQQQMQQMMNDPNQMNQWHQSMMNNPQIMDSWTDVILNEPKMRQQIINKISQEGIEIQEPEELTTLFEKQDLRVQLLQQMEKHNQNMASLVPYYSEDPNLNDMMTEKMAEHNYLMNKLLDQETTVSELDESIKKHMEEHRQLAELIVGISQKEQDPK